ncbi:oxidoreductase [Coniophora puteana RWD-64-598 SS2]|uniref:Oxidoreductase n=1 Tax=Coniophora puteana (strain RWD-64-598) TaxID=741705 RepID=A0A5M3M834_CONPW|nr:oxidoreductase [Coniophora puteana RWD-64-598 SS2]EIW75034.1 oxidoreductase [Coniophora puteana RWD-64-598 SS2]
MADAVAPPTNKWTSWLFQIFASAQPPPLGTLDIDEIEEKAKQVLSNDPSAFLYVMKSAGICTTHDANRQAFNRWRLIPRVLTDAASRNIETTIFGVIHPSPLFVGPVGAQSLVHPEGELAVARAAAKVGVPMVLSTAASRSIEEVAEANSDGHRWYQLYWTRSADVTISLLNRAKANGYTALVITVDTMIIGWRPHDNGKPYLPTGHGFGNQQGLSDPVFMKRFGFQARTHEHPTWPYDQKTIRDALEKGDAKAQEALMLGGQWVGEIGSGAFRTWDELGFIREHWDGPVVLKGILSVDDAEKAIDVGIDGIIVSNHGGRQVDGAIASLDALEMITRSTKVVEAQRNGKLTILFDSGVRTGSDVIKALAMGAQAVLIARPFMYGLAIAGQDGVEQILMQTICDMHITLGLIGYSSVKDLIGKRERVLIKSDY